MSPEELDRQLGEAMGLLRRGRAGPALAMLQELRERVRRTGVAPVRPAPRRLQLDTCSGPQLEFDYDWRYRMRTRPRPTHRPISLRQRLAWLCAALASKTLTVGMIAAELSIPPDAVMQLAAGKVGIANCAWRRLEALAGARAGGGPKQAGVNPSDR